MNIELNEVLVQDASDDALEMAAGGALGSYATCVTTITLDKASCPSH